MAAQLCILVLLLEIERRRWGVVAAQVQGHARDRCAVGVDVDVSGGLWHGDGAWSAVATFGSAFDAGALRVRDLVVGKEAENAVWKGPLAIILFGLGHCDCGDEENAVRVQAYHRCLSM